MKIFSTITGVLILLFMCNHPLFAQDLPLRVQLNKSAYHPGDTIFIKASQASGKHSTLFLMAENDKGFAWEMRWPMLQGASEPDLIIPDSMPPGRYRLFFSVLQNLFTVSGKVKAPAKIKDLSVTLLTAGGEVLESEVPVNDSGVFVYRNVLFENNATLVFTTPGKRDNERLDIDISTVLDSASIPLANQVLDIYIGEAAPPKEEKPFTSINNDPNIRARVLETVTVANKPLNRGELFNKKYSTGLFNDMNERVLNFLDDRHLANSISIFQTLGSRVAGLTVRYGAFPAVSWRGQPVVFYLDELRVSASIIDGIPVDDIAIIKVYPPPFFGNPGGNGGGIAVYTKRGGLSDENYRNAFRVKGYTPLSFTLPTMPDRF
jgi:hypothetical protein